MTLKKLYPTDDSYVDEDSPNSNYGSATDLEVIGFATRNRSFIRFNLTSIPVGSYIVSATLKVYIYLTLNYPWGSTQNMMALLTDDDSWYEDDITWNNQPGVVGGTAEQVSVAHGFTGWKSFDFTDDVRDEFNGDKKISFCLRSNPEDPNEGLGSSCYSKEGSSSYKAVLEVEYNVGGMPKAQILNLQYPSQANVGEYVPISYDIKNIGDGAGYLWSTGIDVDTSQTYWVLTDTWLEINQIFHINITTHVVMPNRTLKIKIEAGHVA